MTPEPFECQWPEVEGAALLPLNLPLAPIVQKCERCGTESPTKRATRKYCPCCKNSLAKAKGQQEAARRLLEILK